MRLLAAGSRLLLLCVVILFAALPAEHLDPTGKIFIDALLVTTPRAEFQIDGSGSLRHPFLLVLVQQIFHYLMVLQKK